ncbi:MAG: hypothetical protein ACKV2T_26875 [Kofleriaceae bacterium]
MTARRVALRCSGLLGLALVAVAYAQPRQPSWEVTVADKVTVAPGESSSISVAIRVDRGLTVSKDASVIVDVQADPGVTVRKKRLGRMDAVDPEADAPRFAVAVKGDTAGEHAVRVRVRCWVCGGKSCRPIDVRKSATLSVVTPPTVAPP